MKLTTVACITSVSLPGDSLNADCRPDQFKCANSKCVEAGQVCDDIDDCGDASDENGCRK